MTTEATYIILSLTVGSTSLTAAGPVKVTRGYIHNGLAAVNVPVQDIFEYSLKSTHDTCSEQSNANQSTWYSHANKRLVGTPQCICCLCLEFWLGMKTRKKKRKYGALLTLWSIFKHKVQQNSLPWSWAVVWFRAALLSCGCDSDVKLHFEEPPLSPASTERWCSRRRRRDPCGSVCFVRKVHLKVYLLLSLASKFRSHFGQTDFYTQCLCSLCHICWKGGSDRSYSGSPV